MFKNLDQVSTFKWTRKVLFCSQKILDNHCSAKRTFLPSGILNICGHLHKLNLYDFCELSLKQSQNNHLFLTFQNLYLSMQLKYTFYSNFIKLIINSKQISTVNLDIMKSKISFQENHFLFQQRGFPFLFQERNTCFLLAVCAFQSSIEKVVVILQMDDMTRYYRRECVTGKYNTK